MIKGNKATYKKIPMVARYKSEHKTIERNHTIGKCRERGFIESLRIGHE